MLRHFKSIALQRRSWSCDCAFLVKHSMLLGCMTGTANSGLHHNPSDCASCKRRPLQEVTVENVGGLKVSTQTSCGQDCVPKNEDQAQESSVTADCLEPIIIDIEEHHLRFRGLQNQVAKLLNLQCCLQWKRELEFNYIADIGKNCVCLDIELMLSCWTSDANIGKGFLSKQDHEGRETHLFYVCYISGLIANRKPCPWLQM